MIALADVLERKRIREGIVLEDGRLLGECWDDWQREDLEALDDPKHRHAYWERPRGHDKTGSAGTEACVELLAGPRDARMYAYAADEDQAGLLLADVAGKLRRGGFVASGAVTIRKKEIVSNLTGAVLEIDSADVASSWGLRPDWLLLDEIEEWRDRALWDALWTATGKRPRCRVIVIGTAGYLKDSLAWEIRTLAEREPNWYFSSRGQCASWIDPQWLDQQRRTLPPHVFARLHENRWVDGVGAWLTAEQVDAIFQSVPNDSGQRVVGLDVGVTRDRSAAAVVRRDAGSGLYCVDTLETWAPAPGRKVELTQVQADVEALSRTNRKAAVIVDPYQAVLMAQQMRAKGFTVVDDAITADTRDKMFAFLRDLIVDGKVRSHPHDEFRSELLQLSWEKTGSGRYRVDHKRGGHDDHVFAVALAAYFLGGQVKRRMLEGYDADSWMKASDAKPTRGGICRACGAAFTSDDLDDMGRHRKCAHYAR